MSVEKPDAEHDGRGIHPEDFNGDDGDDEDPADEDDDGTCYQPSADDKGRAIRRVMYPRFRQPS